MQRNMIMRHVDSLIMLRENMSPPLESEWSAFTTLLQANAQRFDKIKIFVRTPGGGPTPAQANRLRPILKNKPVRVAVVSESLVVRFLGSSMALLNRDLKTFTPDEVEDAYLHLKLTPDQRALVAKIVDDMILELY